MRICTKFLKRNADIFHAKFMFSSLESDGILPGWPGFQFLVRDFRCFSVLIQTVSEVHQASYTLHMTCISLKRLRTGAALPSLSLHVFRIQFTGICHVIWRSKKEFKCIDCDDCDDGDDDDYDYRIVGWGIMLKTGRSWLRFPIRSLDSFQCT
jgi:hypothetical protein